MISRPVFPIKPSAYVGLALLGATLLLGPLNILRRRPNPISTDLRRDVGIWAAVISLVHVAAGLLTHFPGEPWRFFIDDGRLPLLFNQFGAANYSGLGAALILVLLLCLSNDWALRTLRGQRWKALQQLNYGVYVLVVVHALVYLQYEERGLRFLLPVALLVVITGVIQGAGYVTRRRLREQAALGQSQTA